MAQRNAMKHYWWLIHKRRFDIGWGVTGYIKWFTAVIGISAAIKDVAFKFIILMGFIYGITCYLTGWVWMEKKIYQAELEIENQYNPFAIQMREVLKITKDIKRMKL